MKMKEIIYKGAQPKIFIPVFLIGFSLQGYLLGVLNPKILTITGGVNPLDLVTGFSVEYASKFLELLGDSGRDFYLKKFIFTDWFFSLISGFAFTFFLIWLYKKAYKSKTHLYKLGFTPLFIILFDYFENIFVTFMVRNYPTIVESIGNLASMSGILKMVFFYLTILQILFLLLVLLVKRFR